MNIKKIYQPIIITVVFLLYFFNTEVFINSVKDGFQLCYSVIIPSLYIFMVFSYAVSTSSYCEMISIPFSPLFRLLKISNRKLMTYCILSIIGGFATGGQFLNRIKNEFSCDNNLKYILTILTSNNSPAFIITAVGLQMLGSIKTGVLLYISVISSSFITAFILSFLFPYSNTDNLKADANNHFNIIDAIKYSVSGIINICGIVILCFSVCKVIQLYTKTPLLSAIACIMIEVTTACEYICSSLGKNLYIICIALTFCPLSTYFQMKYFDADNAYSFKIMFLSKLFQIPVSLCILRILINMFPVAASVYASGIIQVNMYWFAPHISFYLLILSICFVVIFDRKTKVFTKKVK